MVSRVTEKEHIVKVVAICWGVNLQGRHRKGKKLPETGKYDIVDMGKSV